MSGNAPIEALLGSYKGWNVTQMQRNVTFCF
nr:MAG TPA: hypothetical protein [Caudoviricetes sp.]